MTIDEARTQLAVMLGAAIPADVLDAALQQSLTWDAAGLAPGQPGYVDTYDPYWTAAEACLLMALQPSDGTLKSVTSEGTTMVFEGGVDWWHLAHRWRLRSPMAQASGYGSPLGVITVEQGEGYIPTSDGLRFGVL